MDADGSNQTPSRRPRGWTRCREWSPDGTKIAFTCERGGNEDIYLMDADGSNVTTGHRHARASNASRRSRRTATKIAFTSDRGGNFDIYVLDARDR